MNLKIDQFMDWIRSCLSCGSLFPLRGRLLSRNCLNLANEDLSDGRSHFQILKAELIGYSVWDWHPGKNDCLSHLLVGLKGGKQQSAFANFAQILLQNRLAFGGPLPKQAILIPAPGINLEQDHAGVLAECLSELTGYPVLRALEKTSKQRQRALNQTERRKIRLRIRENISMQQLQHRALIFVDDIVTTAATAYSAWEALPRGAQFEIWCLAQRNTRE